MIPITILFRKQEKRKSLYMSLQPRLGSNSHFPALASWVPGLQVYTNTSQFPFNVFYRILICFMLTKSKIHVWDGMGRHAGIGSQRNLVYGAKSAPNTPYLYDDTSCIGYNYSVQPGNTRTHPMHTDNSNHPICPSTTVPDHIHLPKVT